MNLEQLESKEIDLRGVFTPWRIGLICVFALAVLLYLPALKGVPIWDDEKLLSGTEYGTHDIISAFTHPFGNYFRPLTSASFAIENGLVHGQPLLYHVTNLVLHALTSVLVACLVLILTRRKRAGVLAGLFFAAQPMQVGAIAWIGGRTDALSTFFLTLFLISLVRYHESAKISWLASSLIAFFLAALSKEQAVAILPAVPLSVFVFGTKKWKDAWRLTGMFAGVVAAYIGLWIIGAPPPHPASSGLSDTIMLALRTAAHYGLAFLTPNDPSLITFTLENYKGFIWIPLGAALVVATALFLRYAWKNNRSLVWVAVCGLLVYIPISNCPTVPSLVVGPFRCAEAGIAVACLFGIAAASTFAAKRYLWVGVLGANLAAGAYVTWWGVHQWITPQDFFATVAANDPHFIVGVEFDAHYLDTKGDSAQASKVTGDTLAWLFDTPNWAELLDNQKKGAITPDVVKRLRTNMGIPNIGALANFIATDAFSLAKLGRIPEAAVVARDALIFTPKDAWINFLYGRLILRTDRADAIRHWEYTLNINPDYAECALALAHQRVVDHRYAEAITLLDRALKQLGNNGYGWLDMAYAKLGLKDKPGATAALERAKSARVPPKPSDIDTCNAKIEALSP